MYYIIGYELEIIMKNKKIKRLWILASACIFAVVSGFVIYHQKNTAQKEVTNFIPEFEVAQSQSIQDASVSKGIQIPGYSTIPIKADSEEISVELLNPEENEVYFQISFYLTDTQELIYQSKLIEPGQHLYTIELAHALTAGDYPLTIQYDTFSMDGSFTPKNSAVVNCILSAS